jgi:hypothetical protein
MMRCSKTRESRLCPRAGVDEHLTLQPKGKDAKPYQVKQVRDLIVKYGLGGEE